MYSSHRVRVLGRELQVRSTASDELVRKVEAFVNEKLKEVAVSVNTSDSQIIAILGLMNIAELFLVLVSDNERRNREENERISRILGKVENNLEQ